MGSIFRLCELGEAKIRMTGRRSCTRFALVWWVHRR